MPTQHFYDIEELLRQREGKARPYHEFLRVPTMSCGVYVLPAGALDGQKPHVEDEIYYVISGAANMQIRASDGKIEDREVAAGDIIFVEARREHAFHDITEDLTVLVFFAPAEST